MDKHKQPPFKSSYGLRSVKARCTPEKKEVILASKATPMKVGEIWNFGAGSHRFVLVAVCSPFGEVKSTGVSNPSRAHMPVVQSMFFQQLGCVDATYTENES